MTTKQFINEYFSALHNGGWESYVAEDVTFVVNDLQRPMPGKATYLERAGRFFKSTTAVEIKELFIDGDKAVVLAQYRIHSPRESIGYCDVAEFLAVKDGKLAASSIFFDTKALADFMAQN